MKVQMIADMEVDKVADKVADLSADKEKKSADMKFEMVAYMELTKVAHKVADKKMADMELDIAADMFKTKCVGLKLFDAKCTRLAWLLRFAISAFFRAREFLDNGMSGIFSPGLVTTRRSSLGTAGRSEDDDDVG